MTFKTAGFLAFIGTTLATLLLAWNFVFELMNAVQGLIPAVKLIPSLIYAIAALTVCIFFFVFQREQH